MTQMWNNSLIIILLCLALAHAQPGEYVPPPDYGIEGVGDACFVPGTSFGVCRLISDTCGPNAQFFSGYCSGPAEVQCCAGPVQLEGVGTPCQPSGTLPGVCQVNTSPCAGQYHAGLCPGPSEVQCCAAAPPPDVPPPQIGDVPPPPQTVEYGQGDPCVVPGTSSGVCKLMSDICGPIGRFYPGYCPGSSNVQCCATPVTETPSTAPPQIGDVPSPPPTVEVGQGEACFVPGMSFGVCKLVADGCGPHGQFYPGYCPGSANVQCCAGKVSSPSPTPSSGQIGDIPPPPHTVEPGQGEPCFVPGMSFGVCKLLSDGCGPHGQFYPGYCPGSANVQCCAGKVSTPPPQIGDDPPPPATSEPGEGEVCFVPGTSFGSCRLVSQGCRAPAKFHDGYCPGSENVKCCAGVVPNPNDDGAPRCSVPGMGSGKCRERTLFHCPGQYYAGHCEGPATIQCCVTADGSGNEADACSIAEAGPGYCQDSTLSCPGTAFITGCAFGKSCCVPEDGAKPSRKRISDPTVGLYALEPRKNVRYLLLDSPFSVSFVIWAGGLPINHVEVYMNDAHLAPAQPCAEGWCFSLDFSRVTGPTTLRAAPDRGVAIYLTLPLVRVPFWFRTLAPSTALLPADSWSISAAHEVNLANTLNVPLPLFGFTIRSAMGWSFSMGIQSSGSASMTGNLQASLAMITDCGEAPTCMATSVTGSLAGSLSSQFKFGPADDGIYEPVLQSVSLAITGTVALGREASAQFGIGKFSCRASIALTIAVSPSATVTMRYARAIGLFNLPVVFDSLTGKVALTPSIRGTVSVGPGGLSIIGSLTAAAGLGFSDTKGFFFTGFTVSGSVVAKLDLWFMSASATIVEFSHTWGGKRHLLVHPDTIRNVWSPTVQSGLPSPCLSVVNVYPSRYLGLASAHGTVVFVWISFDPSRMSPHDMQVQFSWTETLLGAYRGWSPLEFVPGASNSVGMPVLEDVDATGQILLVASELLSPALNDSTEARLVFSTFDCVSHSWRAFAPISTAPRLAGATDWMPTLSKDGLALAFVRLHDHDVKPELLLTRFDGAVWSEEDVVLRDASSLDSLALDTDGRGRVLLAYRSEGNSVGLCQLSNSRWQCASDSSVASDDATVPAVVYRSERGQFQLIWSANFTLFVRNIPSDGADGSLHSLVLSDDGSVLSGFTVSRSSDDHSVLVSWISNRGRAGSLSHATIECDGRIFYSATASHRISSTVDWPVETIAVIHSCADILYASMQQNETAGVISVTRASREPRVQLAPIVFAPLNLSSPVITISSKLHSSMFVRNFSGEVAFFFVDQAAQMEFDIGSRILIRQDIVPEADAHISVYWNPSARRLVAGGIVHAVLYDSQSSVIAEQSALPCSIGLTAEGTRWVVQGGQFYVAALISAPGYCHTVVQIRASENNNGRLRLLGEMLTTVSLNTALTTVLIPVPDMSAAVVRLTVNDSLASLDTTVSSRSDSIDISIVTSALLVSPLKTENDYSFIDVSMRVRNGGEIAAQEIPLRISLWNRPQERYTLFERLIGVRPLSHTDITARVPLFYQSNNLLIEVNIGKGSQYEPFLTDNIANIGVQNDNGIAEGSYRSELFQNVSSTAVIAASTPIGRLSGSNPPKELKRSKWLVTVLLTTLASVFVALSLVAVALFVLLQRLKQTSSSQLAAQYSAFTQ